MPKVLSKYIELKLNRTSYWELNVSTYYASNGSILNTFQADIVEPLPYDLFQKSSTKNHYKISKLVKILQNFYFMCRLTEIKPICIMIPPKSQRFSQQGIFIGCMSPIVFCFLCCKSNSLEISSELFLKGSDRTCGPLSRASDRARRTLFRGHCLLEARAPIYFVEFGDACHP